MTREDKYDDVWSEIDTETYLIVFTKVKRPGRFFLEQNVHYVFESDPWQANDWNSWSPCWLGDDFPLSFPTHSSCAWCLRGLCNGDFCVYCEVGSEFLIQKNFVFDRTPSQGTLYTVRLTRSFIPRLRNVVAFSFWYSWIIWCNNKIVVWDLNPSFTHLENYRSLLFVFSPCFNTVVH
jgi:hypothetical protein